MRPTSPLRPEALLRHRDRDGRVRLANTDLIAFERRAPGRYPRTIVRGEGAYLFDDAGARLLDAGHHLGACAVGHGRREIADRLADQAAQLAFSSLDHGLGHPSAVALADRLAPLLPVDDGRFLFTSSGSEAVETAIKVARAYHARRGAPERVKIIGREGSYHGATYAAMSASGIPAAREPYAPLVPGFRHVAQPSPPRCTLCEATCTLSCADDVARTIEREGPETVAAVIGEPVALRQAVKVPAPGYWDRMREICDVHGVLLVVDEVLTGFGRTGRMFASEHWDLRADIVTLAKGLTSGYVPAGAAVVAAPVYEPFDEDPLVHISTYAGHPVACAAALANLDVLEREALPQHAAALETHLRTRLAQLADGHRDIVRHTAIGLLASFEIDAGDRDPRELALDLTHGCLERGMAIRAAAAPGEVVAYFYPPLVVEEADVDRAFAIFDDVLRAVA